jgi:hypothetical protein
VTDTPPPYTGAEAPFALALALANIPAQDIRDLLADLRTQHFTEAAELIMRDAEEQYQRSYSDNKIFQFNGAKRSADLLLAARTTTS